jgi:hypothetical protein
MQDGSKGIVEKKFKNFKNHEAHACAPDPDNGKIRLAADER